MSYIQSKQSLAGTPVDSVELSFRGLGLKYIPKYILSALYTGPETVDFGNNLVEEFDIDYTTAGATLITLDMSDNPATVIKNTTNTFSALTAMKELYIRNLLCPDLSNISAALVTFAALEKIDATGGKIATMFDPSTSMSALKELFLRGNELSTTEVQQLLGRMTVLLGTTNIMNGTLDLRGSYAFPQSPVWISNYSGFTGSFAPGDLIDIQDAGNTVIAKGIIITQGGGQVKFQTVWVSQTVPGTFTGMNNMVNTSQAGTISGTNSAQNDNGYLSTLLSSWNWTVLLDVF